MIIPILENRIKEVERLLIGADEVCLAIAYVRISGVRMLRPTYLQSNAKFKLLVDTKQRLTDKKALGQLPKSVKIKLEFEQPNIQQGGIMSQEDSPDKKQAAENFAEMFRSFGKAISEVFNDPELKTKAKEFADSAADSAKALGSRFQDEDVKDKFRDVGKAAEEFGRSIADHFKTDKEQK